MNDHREKLVEETQRIFYEYKRTEHNKIIQIFHVTVLIIMGFYNLKIDKNSYEAVYLLISLSFIVSAYLFWYLADISNLKLEFNQQELLHNNSEINSSDSKHLSNQYIENFKTSIIIQTLCFISALASHIFIFTAAISFFQPQRQLFCIFTSNLFIWFWSSTILQYFYCSITFLYKNFSRKKFNEIKKTPGVTSAERKPQILPVSTAM